MTPKLKGSVGPFKIYNIGKMRYSIERDGVQFAIANHVSGAYRTAERLNEALKRGDLDTALALGNNDCR